MEEEVELEEKNEEMEAQKQVPNSGSISGVDPRYDSLIEEEDKLKNQGPYRDPISRVEGRYGHHLF